MDLIIWKYSKKWNTIRNKGLGIVEILEINDFKDLECNTLANNTKQPSRKSLNQTIKLDSHPGSHSIKQVNETAIPEVTQSNRSKNHGGRQADFKGGLGGRQPTQEEQMTAAAAATATAAAATSQELFAFGQALGVSRPGTKYPVRGIPHFDHISLFCRSAESLEKEQCFSGSWVTGWPGERVFLERVYGCA